MKNRTRTKVATTTAALTALGAIALAGLPAPASHAVAHSAGPANSTIEQRTLAADHASGHPNVLVFTADDMTVSDLPSMPNVRKLLVDQGTTMTQAIAPTPICAPSRASLLTGQYAHNHGVLTIDGRGGGFKAFKDRNTLPVWLSKAGYHSTFAGKYINGYGRKNPRYRPPGWNNWYGSVDNSTYAIYNTRYNHNGHVVRRPEHNSDVLAGFTRATIASRARSDKPWFAWINFVAPHHGGKRESDDPKGFKTTMPAKRHRNMFRSLALPRHLDMFASGGSPWAGPSLRGKAKAVREVYQQRLEALQSVDEAVGSSIRKLAATGQLSNTYIIFTSDNGFLVGEHNKIGKLVPYDRSLRVPMIVRGPGIPAGRTLRTPTTVPDLAVTIAAIAGVTPGRKVDGINMLPYWLSTTAYDRVIPIEGYPVRNADRRLYSGIRTIEYTYGRTSRGTEVLFDRSADPAELRSVAGLARYASVLTRMRAQNTRYRNCAGTTCPGVSTFTALD